MKGRQWAVRAVNWALEAMGLQRWEVEVVLETGMERVADAHLQPEYEVALVRFDAATRNDASGRTAAIHEVVHMQHAPLYTAWEYVLAMVPEEQRELAHRILNEADELVVQRWAVAWQRQYAHHIQCPRGCTDTASCGIMTMVDEDLVSPTAHEEER